MQQTKYPHAITLQEIEQLEHKCNTLLRPAVLRAIKRFVQSEIDIESPAFPKIMQLIVFELMHIARELHAKDLI